MVGVAVVGILLHRVVGAAHGASVPSLLSTDLVLVAAVAASLSTLVPRAGWAALCALGATPFTVLFPEQVPLIFASGVGLTLLATALLWGSAVRRGARS